MPAEPAVRQFRTLFISDVHLGTRGCQAELLLDFLRCHEAATVYLVGDIIDGWRLKRTWYWPQSHNDLAQKILRLARKGGRIVYIPGNHDEFLRDYLDSHFGGDGPIANGFFFGEADSHVHIIAASVKVKLGAMPPPPAPAPDQPVVVKY